MYNPRREEVLIMSPRETTFHLRIDNISREELVMIDNLFVSYGWTVVGAANIVPPHNFRVYHSEEPQYPPGYEEPTVKKVEPIDLNSPIRPVD